MFTSKKSAKALFPDYYARVEINQPEARRPAESQLLKMFADLQKQLEKQRAETVRGCEQAALERDTTTSVQNQLLTLIEILLRSQSSEHSGEILGSSISIYFGGNHMHQGQSKAR